MKGGMRLKHLLEGKVDAEDEVVEITPEQSNRGSEKISFLGKRPWNAYSMSHHFEPSKKPEAKENQTNHPCRKDRIRELENRYNAITQKCSSIGVSRIEQSKLSPSRPGQSSQSDTSSAMPYVQKTPLGMQNSNTSYKVEKSPTQQIESPKASTWILSPKPQSLPQSETKPKFETPQPAKPASTAETPASPAKPTDLLPVLATETPAPQILPPLPDPPKPQETDPETLPTLVSPAPIAAQLTPAEFSPDPATNLSFRAYAATTHNGKVRGYNEDRVSIIKRIFLDSAKGMPTSFFGLFDGHCGTTCADYLRDKLHLFVSKHPKFATDKGEALRGGLLQCESAFLNAAAACTPPNPAGSCALVCMLSNKTFNLANVGDSRAILSTHRGMNTVALTDDHKPGLPLEKERIFAAGGYIAKSKKQVSRVIETAEGKIAETIENVTFGPYRVFPGGFSVSRSIGDLPAKNQAGAKSMIADPDIYTQEITPDHDFLVLASDGVFDVLGNEAIIKEVWDTIKTHLATAQLKDTCKLACERITQLAMQQDSSDNITVVIVAFQPKEYYLQQATSC